MENNNLVVFSMIDEALKTKIKDLAKDYSDKRQEIAITRIKLFGAMIYRLLTQEKYKFDLIVAPGNSGLYMSYFVEEVYKYCGLDIPKIIQLPIYRFNKDNTFYDNSHLLEPLKKEMENIKDIENVLFIDDEIMTGTSAKNAFELILEANSNINKLNIVIVSEHHWFEWRYFIPKVSVIFYAYARLFFGLNNNIAHILPDDIYNLISPHIKEGASHNHTLGLIVGGKLKKKDQNDKGYFDTEIENKLHKEIKSYNDIKSQVKSDLRNILISGIEDYKDKKFIFRF